MVARVAVIGGGLGGLAAAARLAKLGHQVTVLERSDRLGGVLGTVRHDGFAWDRGPGSTALPAVLRDLFRKTGRPLERELELTALDPIRYHRFPDGSTLALPGGSRAAQLAAGERLAPGLGQAWVARVAGYAETWDRLRRDYLERPYDPRYAAAAATRALRSRESLAAGARRLPDVRLQLVAEHQARALGQDPRQVPGWLGIMDYAEQRFGRWAITGGSAALGEALTERLRTRRVSVETGVSVRDLVMRGGHLVGVSTTAGPVDADLAVCAIDPRLLPELAGFVRRTRPAAVPVRWYLGLAGEAEPGDRVWHGPTPVSTSAGPGPAGHTALTVDLPDGAPLGPGDALAGHGWDIRERIVTQHRDGSTGPSSPWGVQWDGRRTVERRLGPRTPLAGVFAVGAHAAPGAGIPFVGLSAALVAQVIGPA